MGLGLYFEYGDIVSEGKIIFTVFMVPFGYLFSYVGGSTIIKIIINMSITYLVSAILLGFIGSNIKKYGFVLKTVLFGVLVFFVPGLIVILSSLGQAI